MKKPEKKPTPPRNSVNADVEAVLKKHKIKDYAFAFAKNGDLGGILVGGNVNEVGPLVCTMISSMERKVPGTIEKVMAGLLIVGITHAAVDSATRERKPEKKKRV